MNSCKKTRTFTGASWRMKSLECSTHAAPAHEPLVLLIKKKGNDGSSKIFANAASLFSFSISLLRSCCGVQLFSNGDEDRCPGPMQHYSSLLLLQSDNCEMMSLSLVVISRSGLCHSFEARHPSRPTAYPHMGVHMCFPINISLLLQFYRQ